MSMMQDTKIGARISIAMVLPILGLLFFAGDVVVERKGIADDMENIVTLAHLAPTISAVVHEMQKERGTSAVFIGSNGAKFAAELPQQHTDTDTKLAELSNALSGFDAASYGTGLVGKIGIANKALGLLKEERSKVTTFAIKVPQMAAYYTPTIAKLLAIVEEMTLLSTDATITRDIIAYTSFLQAKERAGIERAMGGAGFGAGKFERGVYNNFVGLIRQQQVLLSIFALNAVPEDYDFYKATVTGPDVEEVERMRKIAIASPETGSVEGITGPNWFGTITKKINLMKMVEDKIAEDLSHHAEKIGGAAQNAFMLMAAVTLILLIVTAVFVTMIVRGITGPIGGITGAMNSLAGGNMETVIDGADRGDEIGSMAGAVQVFKENMIKNDQMTAAQDRENAAKEERSKAMDKMAAEFETSVTGILSSVSSASGEMSTAAETMSTIAEDTSQKATTVAAAAEEASTNVQTVASAAEELSSSISEISRQVAQSTQVSSKAVEEVNSANDKVQSLASAASKIGEVVALITDIADQTNLLALNATIEAARAGDAGKGFAVVASEVKNLATQTAKATEEISSQIGGIQSSTEEAVTAIEAIGNVIGEMSEISSTIAAAVEEQGAATQEIARNVEQASAGTADVTTNIALVTQSANETGEKSASVLDAAGQLTMQADALSREVGGFLKGIKEV